MLFITIMYTHENICHYTPHNTPKYRILVNVRAALSHVPQGNSTGLPQYHQRRYYSELVLRKQKMYDAPPTLNPIFYYVLVLLYRE